MTDTYNGKPIAEMTREELEEALLELLKRQEEYAKREERVLNMLAGHMTYGGGVLH